MNCAEIYKMVCDHSDENIEIFICHNNWANCSDGILVTDNIDEETFLALFGKAVPKDWRLVNDSTCHNVIDLGFLF